MNYILLYSGGLDSLVMLYYALNLGKNNSNSSSCSYICLTYDYGQTNKKEIEYAKKVINILKKSYNVKHEIVDIKSLSWLYNKSKLIDLNSKGIEGFIDTYVPNRNMIFISLAVAYAINVGGGEVWIAVHKSDTKEYPDTRKDFIENLSKAVEIASNGLVKLVAPFLDMYKHEIVELGIKLNVPFEMSWSCYMNYDEPCMSCLSCKERLEAFKKAKVKVYGSKARS